jgi:pyridoxal phosphate enzyme (YggS family)
VIRSDEEEAAIVARLESRSEPGDLAAEAASRLATVQARIEAAARRAGRDPTEITLLGASKYQDPSRIAATLRAGLRCLGENYVQESRDKQPEIEALVGPEIARETRWHMIGALQRNKVRDVVRIFDVVETLDRSKLALEIDKRARPLGRRIDALVQLNLSAEPQKNGIEAGALPELLEICAPLEHLRVIGLMTIPAPQEDPGANRPVFARLRELRDASKNSPGGEALSELSMGMSRDFEIAIEEGATLVRVGRDLFGPRPEPPQANEGIT